METTEMFTIDEWIPSVVYMYNGILFYDKTEWSADTCHYMDITFLKHHAQWK